jgi:hypothetical protein
MPYLFFKSTLNYGMIVLVFLKLTGSVFAIKFLSFELVEFFLLDFSKRILELDRFEPFYSINLV